MKWMISSIYSTVYVVNQHHLCCDGFLVYVTGICRTFMVLNGFEYVCCVEIGLCRTTNYKFMDVSKCISLILITQNTAQLCLTLVY